MEEDKKIDGDRKDSQQGSPEETNSSAQATVTVSETTSDANELETLNLKPIYGRE